MKKGWGVGHPSAWTYPSLPNADSISFLAFITIIRRKSSMAGSSIPELIDFDEFLQRFNWCSQG